MIDRLHRSYMALACCLATLGGALPAARGATAEWTTSDLDVFFYNMAVSAGSRALAPTFLGGITLDANTQQFNPSTATDPARLGMNLTAFNTAPLITPNLDPARYQINSLTFRATWTYDMDPNRLIYRDTPISQSEILAEVSSGNATRQKPMELYGVGLRNGYAGYEFSAQNVGPPLLDEITKPYASAGAGYNAYPIVGSTTQPGTYIDVSNSVTGGYSATEPTNTTGPFTPTPWAIGTTNLSPGAEIEDNTTFIFTLNLNEPGVRPYVQQSLSDGAIGFFLSSLHSTGEFGGGGGYPRWYTKEAAGFPYFVPTATTVPGDYNVSDLVDAADYVLWRKGGPLQNQVDDPNTVDAQDYMAWRALFGRTSFLPHLFIDYSILPAGTGSNLTGNHSVPEPSAVLLSISGFACVCISLVRRSHKWRRSA